LITKGNAFGITKSVAISYNKSVGSITVSGLQCEQCVVIMVLYEPQQHDVQIFHGVHDGLSLSHGNAVKRVEQIGRWNGGAQDYNLSISSTDGLKVAILVQAGSGGPI